MRKLWWPAMLAGLGVAVAALSVEPVAAQEGAAPLSDIARYNRVIGTQTFGAGYQFTDEPLIVETAQAILDMGSNVLKFGMGKNYFGEAKANVREAVPRIDSLVELARDEPAHRRVLDMPFAHYLIWAYCFRSGWWHDGFSEAEQEQEYRELYDFACHLLREYSGTGKSFYLGHWEGDWHLRAGYDTQSDDKVTPEAVQGMIDWLNTRQRAVDDAKRDTPHQDVSIRNYCEVNLARLAMAGRPTVTNDVLPHVDVDYVSYSSYDSMDDLGPALDYIESKLKPRPTISGKRVFIGEYGFPAIRHSPEEQAELARRAMRDALAWGCPFVLYWEMYNNEVDDEGRQRGFWLIDNEGRKQPVYETHRLFYEWAEAHLEEAAANDARLPTPEEFAKSAVAYLDEQTSTM